MDGLMNTLTVLFSSYYQYYYYFIYDLGLPVAL